MVKIGCFQIARPVPDRSQGLKPVQNGWQKFMPLLQAHGAKVSRKLARKNGSTLIGPFKGFRIRERGCCMKKLECSEGHIP
jgi:hypothetical protein